MTFENGIYFGLDEDEYRADPALSQSGMKQLLTSPKKYWWESSMNPDRPTEEETQTKAKAFGKALHTLILEPDIFKEKYVQDFVLPKDALDTTNDLKDWLKANAIPFKSTDRKPALIEKVLDADPNACIKEMAQAEFYRALPDGVEVVSDEDWDNLGQLKKVLSWDEELKHVFSKGMPEVSIFWEDPDSGVRMKGRFDYLSTCISDVKTFSNPYGVEVEQCCINATRVLRYDLQYYTYQKGKNIVMQGIKDGTYAVHGDVNKEWIEYVANSNDNRYFLAFVESSAPFDTCVLELRKLRETEDENLYYMKAEDDYKKAIKIYQYCMEEFGAEKPWIIRRGIRVIEDADFPTWFLTGQS